MPKPKSKSKSKLKSQRKSKQQTATPETPQLSLKEQLALKRQAAKARQEFISLASSTFFGSLFLGLLLFPIGGPKATAGVTLGITSLVLSSKYPRQALWAFLIYMPFGGTVVYALAGGNAIFQLAKDAFFIPAAFSIYQEYSRKKQLFIIPKAIRTPFFIILGLSILTLLAVNLPQQFAPLCASLPRGVKVTCRNGQPIIMGLLGLKALLGYLPLITCGYYLIRTKKELLFLTRLNVVLALICCILGLIQYQFLSSGRCEGTRGLSGEDLFKATLDARCLVGGALVFSPDVGMIRLPGTFVSPWHWAWFLISNAFLTYATAFSDPSPLWRMAGLAGMGVVIINSFISGQRIALALVPVVFIILLILTGQVANLKRFIPIAIGIGVLAAIGSAMFPDVVQERIDSFVGRWNASPPTEFIAHQAEFTSKGQSGIFGSGIGRATNSARAYGADALIETYYPKLLFELGPLGVMGFLGLVTAITYVTFKTYRSVKEPNLRSFAASFWVFILVISYNTYWYPLDTDPVAVYYWFIIGVLVRLPEIERQEKEKLLPEIPIKDKQKKRRKV
ncbi:hormogonium polysaccharide biosynthesis protein HpsL [Aerosakkonemataceae cyanobacterium BLCC-F154]|uniref:Hormogonium polysaccharide biosynthesis protein HpsL n=1 Tax=Floridaenema fluviatile BLCC-F154 TaxID=3153640 RepID=A0ABV4YKV5_9CYAN